MNLPNSITLVRILSIPVLIWVLSSSRFTSANGEKEIIAAALFIAASITDGIDGFLARRRGQITTMGMLLDPLADKLLIAAAFVTLVQFNPRLVPAWIAVVIIGREFLVSGLRSIAASEGFTIEASDPIGSPSKPLTIAQFGAKFRDCARHAAQPLSEASVDAALAAIGRLEALPDARELMTP